MGEFFRGWRRKVGCVTLLMACVFMSAWVRSMMIGDFLHRTGTGNGFIEAESSNGFLIWWSSSKPLFTKQPPPLCWVTGNLSNSLKIQEQWPLIRQFGNRSFVAVPYWSVVIPLTLLSAYLLFSKPRK